MYFVPDFSTKKRAFAERIGDERTGGEDVIELCLGDTGLTLHYFGVCFAWRKFQVQVLIQPANVQCWERSYILSDQTIVLI